MGTKWQGWGVEMTSSHILLLNKEKVIRAWSLIRTIAIWRAHCKFSLNTFYILLWTDFYFGLRNCWTLELKEHNCFHYVSFIHSFRRYQFNAYVTGTVFRFSVNYVVTFKGINATCPANWGQTAGGQWSDNPSRNGVSKARPCQEKRDTLESQCWEETLEIWTCYRLKEMTLWYKGSFY